MEKFMDMGMFSGRMWHDKKGTEWKEQYNGVTVRVKGKSWCLWTDNIPGEEMKRVQKEMKCARKWKP